jgi:hypothetical protein
MWLTNSHYEDLSCDTDKPVFSTSCNTTLVFLTLKSPSGEGQGAGYKNWKLNPEQFQKHTFCSHPLAKLRDGCKRPAQVAATLGRAWMHQAEQMQRSRQRSLKGCHFGWLGRIFCVASCPTGPNPLSLGVRDPGVCISGNFPGNSEVPLGWESCFQGHFPYNHLGLFSVRAGDERLSRGSLLRAKGEKSGSWGRCIRGNGSDLRLSIVYLEGVESPNFTCITFKL